MTKVEFVDAYKVWQHDPDTGLGELIDLCEEFIDTPDPPPAPCYCCTVGYCSQECACHAYPAPTRL